jgi:hypothetical protein
MQKLPQEATNLSHELNKAGQNDETVICGESVATEPLQVNKFFITKFVRLLVLVS